MYRCICVCVEVDVEVEVEAEVDVNVCVNVLTKSPSSFNILWNASATPL